MRSPSACRSMSSKTQNVQVAFLATVRLISRSVWRTSRGELVNESNDTNSTRRRSPYEPPSSESTTIDPRLDALMASEKSAFAAFVDSFTNSERESYLGLSSGPDGRVNVHPRTRPRQLPRMRRGWKRPCSISSHAGELSAGSVATESVSITVLSVSSIRSNSTAIMQPDSPSRARLGESGYSPGAAIRQSPARSLLPNLWKSAFPCHRCFHPSIDMSAVRTARKPFPGGSSLPGT